MGRRPDGYHLLESFFWPLSLADELTLTPDGRREFEAVWAGDALRKTEAIPGGAQNIVSKTQAGYPDFSDSVRLLKRIPMGAGMGGGSSNAGTLLRELHERYATAADRRTPEAEALGADVPYFLDPRPAWVSGIGETRHYFDLDESVKAIRFFLVFPEFGCDTKAVFAEFKKSNAPFSAARRTPLPKKISRDAFLELAGGGHNDLFAPAAALFPVLRRVTSALEETDPLFCGMSGSGSTCYAAYESQNALEKKTKGLSEFFRSTHCATTTVRTHG